MDKKPFYYLYQTLFVAHIKQQLIQSIIKVIVSLPILCLESKANQALAMIINTELQCCFS